MNYAYVKLKDGAQDIADKAMLAKTNKVEAQKIARDRAINEIGCDEILYGRGNSIYIGYNGKPESENPWWRKNDVNWHDGFWVVSPKVNTEQYKALSSIRREYSSVVDALFDVNKELVNKYKDLPRDVCGSASGGGGMVIANPSFGVCEDENGDLIVIGQLPFNNPKDLVIPPDFVELTATEAAKYIS